MKKIILTMALAAGLTASAQVKVGTNPTTMATNANFQVEGNIAGGNQQFVVLQNGNVGIGTAAPEAKLAIRGAEQTINLAAARNFPATIHLDTPNDAVGTEQNILFTASYGGINSPNKVALGSIGVIREVNGTNQDYGQSSLAFRTTGGTISTLNTEKMRILGNGNVGIGTTAPTNKLTIRNDVVAPTSLEPTALKLFNGNDGGSGIEFSNSASGKSKISFGVTSSGSGTDDTYLGFSTGTNATIQERMRITENGNVGIGTTAPTAKLSIVGLSGYAAPVDSNVTLSLENTTDGLIATPAKTIITFRGGSTPTELANITSLIETGNTARGTLIFSTKKNTAGTPVNASMTIQESNVGIGTTAPTEKLQVEGNIKMTPATSWLKGVTKNLIKEGNFGYAGYSAVQLGDGAAASISMGVDVSAVAGPNFRGSREMIIPNNFYITQVNAANTDFNIAVISVQNGKMGISTTAPNNLLDLGTSFGLAGSAAAKKFAIYNSTAGDAFHGLGMANNGMEFHAGSTATQLPYMFLGTNGRVGIGTVLPTSKLHVVGLPVFVDDAAAAAGLLTAGAFWVDGMGIVHSKL